MSDVPKMLPWSHSKLGLYEDCPARAKFRYIMKFPTTKHAAASRGTNTHQGIEDYLHGKIEFLPEESPAAKFLPMLAEIKKRKPLIEHKQAVDVEWSPAEFHECWGRCVVDAIVVEKSVVDIQEWKTGKIYPEHKEQRETYAAFAMSEWPDKKEYRVTTYYFDQNHMVELTFKKPEIMEIRQEIEQRVDFMSFDDIYAPRPSWKCRYCDYSRTKNGPCKVA